MRTVCGVRGQPPPLPEQEAAATCTPVPTQTFPGSPGTNSRFHHPRARLGGAWGKEGAGCGQTAAPLLARRGPLAGRPERAALLQPVRCSHFFPWYSHIQKREPHASEVCLFSENRPAPQRAFYSFSEIWKVAFNYLAIRGP